MTIVSAKYSSKDLENIPLLVVLTSVFITEDDNDEMQYTIVDQKGLNESGELFSLTEEAKDIAYITQEYIDLVRKRTGFKYDERYTFVSIFIKEDIENSSEPIISHFAIEEEYSFLQDIKIEDLSIDERKNIFVREIKNTLRSLVRILLLKTRQGT